MSHVSSFGAYRDRVEASLRLGNCWPKPTDPLPERTHMQELIAERVQLLDVRSLQAVLWVVMSLTLPLDQ